MSGDSPEKSDISVSAFERSSARISIPSSGTVTLSSAMSGSEGTWNTDTELPSENVFASLASDSVCVICVIAQTPPAASAAVRIIAAATVAALLSPCFFMFITVLSI